MQNTKQLLDEYMQKQETDPTYIAFDLVDQTDDIIQHAECLIEVIQEQKQYPGLTGVEEKFDSVEIEFDPQVEEKQLSYGKVFRKGQKRENPVAIKQIPSAGNKKQSLLPSQTRNYIDETTIPTFNDDLEVDDDNDLIPNQAAENVSD